MIMPHHDLTWIAIVVTVVDKVAVDLKLEW